MKIDVHAGGRRFSHQSFQGFEDERLPESEGRCLWIDDDELGFRQRDNQCWNSEDEAGDRARNTDIQQSRAMLNW